MKQFLLYCFLLILSKPAFAGIFNAQQMTLENGLEVVVIPNHRAPIVHHMLWYKAGSAQELKGYSGVAHFLEHLLFKGTEHPERPLKPGEFSQNIKKLGGDDNAFTSKDYTAYYQTVSKEHLKTVMQMEADRIRHAMPPEPHVLSERDVVIEERNSRTENNPQARFFEKVQDALFPNHPYGRPVIGLPDEIRKMNHNDTKAFYDRWYYPNNAVLVITGDITLKEIRTDIEKIYGGIPRGVDTPKTFPKLAPSETPIRLIEHDEQVKQPLWVRGYRVPSFRQNKQGSLALQVLENILDGGATTRLYKKLVVENKKAINVSFSYNSDQFDTASLWITATPTKETPPEELEEYINNILTELSESGVTDQEIDEAKTRLKNAAIFARDSLSTPARVIGTALTTGATLDDVETWDKQIDAVTKEAIHTVAKQYLTPIPENYNYVTAVLLPKEATEPKVKKEKAE